MSFSFGQQTQGVAQPFGSTANTTSGFGSFGSSFGQTPSQPTGFGGGFGGATNTSTVAPAFGSTNTGFGTGSTFGSTQTGGLFGSQQTQQQTVTPFGATQTAAPAFGAGQTTGFGGTTATSGFGTQPQGTSLFGNQPQTSLSFSTTPAQPAFGTTQSSFGGGLGTSSFGTGQPSLFSTSQANTGFGTSQPSTFGTNTQTGGSWFGSTQQQQQQPQASTFSGFGGGGGLFGGQTQQQKPGFSFLQFGNQQPQPQQPPAVDEQAAFHQTIFGCFKFGDERDSILANLNYLQASWGAGKGFYSQSNPPVQFTDKNVLYRFKSVVYSHTYTESNEDGNVVLHIDKPQKKVVDEEAQLINALQSILAKPNIFFKIVATKAVNEDKTLIILTADDRTTLRRILATDLASALQQPILKPQLDNLAITSISAKVKPSPEQLRAYLDNPPAGMDPRIWKRAQEDNPDPENMIPIPLLGPEELKNRLDAQQKETQQHANRLKVIADEVTSMHNKHITMNTEIAHLKHRFLITTHRMISVALKLQMIQRRDHPLQPDEKELRNRIQELDKQLNSSTQYRGRLNELMSHVRLHKATSENKSSGKYSLDDSTLDQVKEFLNLQQGSITHLVNTIKACMDYSVKLDEGLREFGEKDPTL